MRKAKASQLRIREKSPKCLGEPLPGGWATCAEEALVEGVLALVRKHNPLHVSLVGGEPLVRHRELSRILPELSRQGVFALVATSGVIPIPAEWMRPRRGRVAELHRRTARAPR